MKQTRWALGTGALWEETSLGVVPPGSVVERSQQL